MNLLTRDNPSLSEPNSTPNDGVLGSFAVSFNPVLDDRLRGYIDASLADATRTAYRADLDRFVACGGSIPTTDLQIANYLADHAATHAPATLTRWIASIAKAHRAAGFQSPTGSELVRSTLRGIRRSHGAAQRQAKPLLRDDLFSVLDATGSSSRDVRDRALLLLGFAGGFRRCELVGLEVSDLELVRQGLVVTLRQSKTDQEGAGRKIGIPLGRTRWCPVAAITYWLDIAGITEGPMFRPLDRHGNVGAGRLSREAVSIVVRERVAAVGIDPAGYSGHSLRAGFATSAAQAGVSTLKIRAQTGHASDTMLARYIRDGELFVANAAARLL